MCSGWPCMAVVLAAGRAGEHGVVHIEQAASHMLHAPCVETGPMPHIESPTRPCDRVATMETNLCRLPPKPGKRLPHAVDNQQHCHAMTEARPGRQRGGTRGYVDNGWLSTGGRVRRHAARHPAPIPREVVFQKWRWQLL
jgi:hypothetical protein